MDKQVVENKFNRVHAFQSSAAVGLIVENSFKADGQNAGPFEGAFLSPEEARAVAKHLTDFADLAEADRNTPQSVREQRFIDFINRTNEA